MTCDELDVMALRYDTALSRAKLRAPGVPPTHHPTIGPAAIADRYGGLAECMAQRHGVAA